MLRMLRGVVWRPRAVAGDVLSATALAIVGDVACQKLEHRFMGGSRAEGAPIRDLDMRRLGSLTAFSAVYIGGFLHVLYQLYSPLTNAAVAGLLRPGALRTALQRPSSVPHAFGCACVDNVHCVAIYIPSYFIGVGILQGHGLQNSLENLNAEWRTTYFSCSGFWFPFMMFNMYVVPAARRVQCMATANLVWNVVIDYLAHRRVASDVRREGS